MMNTHESMKKTSSISNAHRGLASDSIKSDLDGGVGAIMPRAKVVELPTSVPFKSSLAKTDTSETIFREKDINSQIDAGKKKWRKKNAIKDMKNPVNDVDFTATIAVAGGSLENIQNQNQPLGSLYLKSQDFAKIGRKNFNEKDSVEQLVALTSSLKLSEDKNLNSKPNKHRKKTNNANDKGVYSRNDIHNPDSLSILPVMEKSTGTKSSMNEGGLSIKYSKRSKKKFGRNKKKQQREVDQAPCHMGYSHDGYPRVADMDFSTNAEGAAILASIGQEGYAKYFSGPRCDERIQAMPPPENHFPRYESQVLMHPTHPIYMEYDYGSAQFPPEMYYYPVTTPECYQPHHLKMNPHEGLIYYNQGGGECIMSYDPNYYNYPYCSTGQAYCPQIYSVDPGGQGVALNIDAPSFEPGYKDNLTR
ncbi:hypothetical protein ACHAXS_014039 [Conticribra weissflogii]